jgi:hypothetical protein
MSNISPSQRNAINAEYFTILVLCGNKELKHGMDRDTVNRLNTEYYQKMRSFIEDMVPMPFFEWKRLMQHHFGYNTMVTKECIIKFILTGKERRYLITDASTRWVATILEAYEVLMITKKKGENQKLSREEN